MVKHKSVVGCLESRHVHARALSHKSVAAASTKKSQSSLCVLLFCHLCWFCARRQHTRANFANEDLGLVGGRLLTRWPRTRRRLEEMGWKASERILLCDADNSGSARLEPDFPNPHFLFYFWRQQSLRRRLRIIWRRPLSLRETEIMRL
jgi:hypothetical protein